MTPRRDVQLQYGKSDVPVHSETNISSTQLDIPDVKGTSVVKGIYQVKVS